MEKSTTQILLELLEGWVEACEMAQTGEKTVDDTASRIEFLYQMSVRAIEDAKALPHPQASDSRPSDPREDEWTVDGRSIITRYKRSRDWIAYTEDRPNRWEAGRTEREAIDKLLVTINAENGRSEEGECPRCGASGTLEYHGDAGLLFDVSCMHCWWTPNKPIGAEEGDL